MRSTNVVAVCIFNKLLAAGLFLALDGISMRTDPSTSKLAVFIHNESLFVVSAAATNAFHLKHTQQLSHSICPAGSQIKTVEYGKIVLMLLNGNYYGCVHHL